MSANKPLAIEINEHRTMWHELWWRMSDGDAMAYREIKKMDVFEFWTFFDKWRERVERERDAVKKQNEKLKRR